MMKLVFADEKVLHSTLSLACFYLTFTNSDNLHKLRLIEHRGQCFTAINRALASNDTCASDGTILSVLHMAGLEVSISNIRCLVVHWFNAARFLWELKRDGSST